MTYKEVVKDLIERHIVDDNEVERILQGMSKQLAD